MFLLTLQNLHFSDIMAAGSLHVLQCSFALPALGIKNDHDSKTFSPKRLMMSDLILDGRFLHPSKAPFPISVTLFGILILVSELQYAYLQPIITQYFIDNKSEIWLLFLIAHSKR